MTQTPLYDLATTFVRLRGDASVEPLAVDDTFWERLTSGELGDFHNEFLLAVHAFEADWSMWEMHPNGDEIVCLLSGEVTLVLEHSGERRSVELARSGAFVVVPRGTWHTARVGVPSRMLFVTAGEGTVHREGPG